MLTKRQKEVFDFISVHCMDKGFAPSLIEIGKEFGLSSVATVHQHIETLQRKGFLKKIPHQPRAVEPLGQPISGRRIEIALMGKVAAGEPIQAVQDPEPLDVPPWLLSRSGRHYALRVKGDSMTGEGIEDGDVIVVREQHNADAGELVVALIDGEAAVKRFYPRKDYVELRSSNPAYKPIVVTGRLNILGKVVGLLRKY